jgi:hypothetical protein|tara:strand:+ start:35095 stop:36435 length:1341 start_codon:yes stop_codon:yes gene_type:complete
MTHRYYRKWRRVSLLSATFLFAIFLSVSCKKKESLIGSNAYDPTELLNAGAVDTFTLLTYTIIQDSVFTKNRLLNVLGEMNDPVFGKVNASFYTQIRLASANPNFDDLTQISIDSFVLALRFADYTGNPSTQTFEVYELNDEISSDSAVKYYDFDTIAIKQPNLLMPGKGTFKPDPIGDAIVDTVAVAPQMRLSLDTNLARTFMQEAAISGGSFASNDNFVNYFKGFKINVNNPTQAPNQGAVYSFDMRSTSSKLTIYYKQMELVGGVMTPVRKTYDFVINSNCQSFNHVEFERAGTKVQQAVDNKSLGALEFYAQSFGLQAVLEIPGLSNLPKTAVIHRAVLDLPIQYQTGSNYNTGIQMSLFNKLATDSRSIRPLYNPTISDITKSVTVNMRGYIQDVVAGKVANEPIYMAPLRDNYSMDRIIFNGSNTINKVKPKLYIIYTEF